MLTFVWVGFWIFLRANMQNPEDRTPACYVMNFLKENCLKMRMGAGPGQGRWGPCKGGPMYGEVQCIMSNGHMEPMPVDIMTDRRITTENITFLQLSWQAVKN